MLGVKRNARNANEIITGVTVPVLDGWQGYAKVGVRNAMVISVASACLAVDKNSSSVRIALGAVGPTIIRCRDAESWLEQQLDLAVATSIDLTMAKEFGRRVALESKPIDDHRSTAEYRRHAVGVLAQRLITRAYSS
jgi:CO/xanthine dehydrogenase FAD-binding subunit